MEEQKLPEIQSITIKMEINFFPQNCEDALKKNQY